MIKSDIVCHECDLLVQIPELGSGEVAYCPRCNYSLTSNRPHALQVVFAFAVTALLFLGLSNAFPFLQFSAGGQEKTVTLLQSVSILATQNYPELALIVLLLIVAIPASFLIGVVYVSVGIAIGKKLPMMRRVLRMTLQLLPWSMADIFLTGILVSFVKIMSMADVALGMSFWAYVMFTISFIVVSVHLDKRQLWSELVDSHVVAESV